MKNILGLFIVITSFISCNNNADKADGYGNFEATEVTISAEANGKLEYLKLEEGDVIESGIQVGIVDTLQLYYIKEQLIASKNTVNSKSKNVLSQISVLKEQLKTALIEEKRIQNMYVENAATQRQLDEIEGEVSVLKKQIKSVETQNAPILKEVNSINVQIEKIEDQIQKSKIVNPIKGTILSKYVQPNEVVSFGKPLYKIADISEMILRVYVSEPQLSQIKIGQKVTVKIDSTEDMKKYKGTISWISSVAEFTPKIIQTKEERINLVYAIKVKLKNDGSLKIGMPAEMWLKG